MGKITYNQWINGGCGCNGKKRSISGTDACSCDNILLEISHLHTDDLTLQDEIDDLSGDVQTKLDASAYTPTDLSDYYTKEQVDELIPSGSSVDAYTKAESDARFQPIGNYQPAGNYALKSEIPSLDGYATEQWVNNKHYLTEHQPLKTINGYSISGTGNIEITSSGGSISIDGELNSGSTNPVANSAITVALNSKLDESAYTPSVQVQSDWNATDPESMAYIKHKPTIPSLDGYATEQWVNNKHYITSGDSVFNNYATTANTYTKAEVDNKFWCGTQAQYDALVASGGTRNDILYLIHS